MFAHKRRSLLAFAGGMAVVMTTAAPSFAASTLMAPDFTQYGFSNVIAQKTILPTQSATITAPGNIAVTVPTGAFTDPVKFEVLQAPLTNMEIKAPKGQEVLSDFAFKVIDLKTQKLIKGFQKPVMFSVTNPGVTSKSIYWNVATNGAFTQNPVPATISGTTLSHPIKGAAVGWAVTTPTSVPDFLQYGFTNIVAQQKIMMGMAATVKAGDMTFTVPAGAFNCNVEFQVLQAPGGLMPPSGRTVLTNFALRVVDLKHNDLIGAFKHKPIVFSVTNMGVNAQSQYDNVTTSGAFALNPKSPTISGNTLSHPLKGAPVAWAVTNPVIPNFSKLGFSKLLASQMIPSGQAATLHANGITVKVPAGTFSQSVTFKILQAPDTALMPPKGQHIVTNFAFEVTDSQGLVGKFNKPVLFSVTSNQIMPKSHYYNITPGGAFELNPVSPTVSGQTLTHPIKAALVAWAVTSPPAATSPVTGFPLDPILLLSALLVLGGAGLLLYRPRTTE